MARGSKHPIYKMGDVVRHRDEAFDDIRIIFAVTSDCYFYLENREGQGLFYNPTHAAVGHNSFELKWRKIGEVEDTQVLMDVVASIASRFGEVFRFAEGELQKIKTKLI